MSHNVRTRVDGAWVNGLIVTAAELDGFDTVLAKNINADDGGTWNPGSAVHIGGGGMTFMGPTVLSNGALVKTPLASGVRISFGDNDYFVLFAGHTGASRSIVRSFNDGVVALTLTVQASTDGTESVQTMSPGATFSVPLPAHDGATMTTVLVHFAVSTAHGAIPAALPRLRVVRMDVNGVKQALKSAGSGAGSADANGWVTMATPASGAAWYAAAADKTFTYTCDTRNVLDRATYTYWLEVVDESGTGAFAGPTDAGITGNIWRTTTTTLTTIADMRPQ